MMTAFGKLAAGGCSWRSSAALAQSISTRSQGTLGLFSTSSAPSAVTKKPTPPGNRSGEFTRPTTILPTPPAPYQRVFPENKVLMTSLQSLQKKQQAEINDTQGMLELLRIARLPSNSHTPQTIVPISPPKEQHTFQAMNRNMRKPKRANHGKRPCSRVRRKYKKRGWANPSRKG
ncbi:hypothetical protein ACHAWF_007632 [Thalassiosira exigua]